MTSPQRFNKPISSTSNGQIVVMVIYSYYCLVLIKKNYTANHIVSPHVVINNECVPTLMCVLFVQTPDPECLFTFHAGPIQGLDVSRKSHLMATTSADCESHISTAAHIPHANTL